jgi:TPR repeat protein
MYREGKGVASDVRKAAQWYRKTADQGDATGQYLLGFMYEAGLGVSKDDGEAAQWYRKAAEQGDKLAKEALERLGHH